MNKREINLKNVLWTPIVMPLGHHNQIIMIDILNIDFDLQIQHFILSSFSD